MEIDISSKMTPESALDIQAITSDTTTVGNIIDSQGFEALDLVLYAGTLTDGNYAVTIEHGDDSGLSDAASVPTEFLVGSLPSIDDTADNSASHFGYVGKKRYVRVSVVSTSTSTGGTLGVLANKGFAKSAPTISTTVPTS